MKRQPCLELNNKDYAILRLDSIVDLASIGSIFGPVSDFEHDAHVVVYFSQCRSTPVGCSGMSGIEHRKPVALVLGSSNMGS